MSILRFKQLLLFLLVSALASLALASSALAASPAWWVNGSLLKTGEREALAETTNVKENFAIDIGSNDIVCSTVTFKHSYIEGEKARSDESIVLGNCTATNENCHIATSIKLAPLKSTLISESGETKLRFEPASGSEVATISFTGAKCPLSGKVTIDGTMACNYPGVETEQVEHVLDFTLSSGTNLKVGSTTVTLQGVDGFTLLSGKNWSAR